MNAVLLRRIGCQLLRVPPPTAVRCIPRLQQLPRFYSTQFIPVQQLLQSDSQHANAVEEDVEEDADEEGSEMDEALQKDFLEYLKDPAYERNMQDEVERPYSPAFYTGRHQYYDTLVSVRTAIGQARSTLKTLSLLPLPEFARASLLPLPTNWKDIDGMSAEIGLQLNTTRYRRLITLLNELHELLRVASTAGSTDLADMLERIVAMFERGGAYGDHLAPGERKKIELDEFGRSYSLGRRKTSSARVWMIPVAKGSPVAPYAAQEKEQPEPTETEPALAVAPPSEPAPPPTDSLASLLDIIDPSSTSPQIPVLAEKQPPPTPKKVDVPISTILVNNIPISQYFPNPGDREKVTYPLKVAGVLGKFNVFTIARGGGSTGQTGAIAHGITRGLLAHDEGLLRVLRKGDELFVVLSSNLTLFTANLVKRDPRMVERKKTGRAKAREGVSRLFQTVRIHSCSCAPSSSTLGSNDSLLCSLSRLCSLFKNNTGLLCSANHHIHRIKVIKLHKQITESTSASRRPVRMPNCRKDTFFDALISERQCSPCKMLCGVRKMDNAGQ